MIPEINKTLIKEMICSMMGVVIMISQPLRLDKLSMSVTHEIRKVGDCSQSIIKRSSSFPTDLKMVIN